MRIAPSFGSSAALGSAVERNVCVYRRTWLMFVSGFFEPLFYLFGIGFGLGSLVGAGGPRRRPIPYELFVAPALLASAAMNGAIFDGTFNVFFKLTYVRTSTSVLATPLSAGDVAVGEVGWALIRGGLYAVGFLVVMWLLGLVVSRGCADDAGRAAHRLRLRRRRDGATTFMRDVAPLRVHHHGRSSRAPASRRPLPRSGRTRGGWRWWCSSRRCITACDSSGR